MAVRGQFFILGSVFLLILFTSLFLLLPKEGEAGSRIGLFAENLKLEIPRAFNLDPDGLSGWTGWFRERVEERGIRAEVLWVYTLPQGRVVIGNFLGEDRKLRLVIDGEGLEVEIGDGEVQEIDRDLPERFELEVEGFLKEELKGGRPNLLLWFRLEDGKGRVQETAIF
ncbi:MAG: hypothetical protein DRP12_00650 [Candidatus Aenigmatarchaeota archaeon]|nr:MAG: hypothetical protein DRP12_00650 [Candidatus Aenigmarchaeota archaeon]